ncbi:MAG: hypothetical protein U0319_10680 [Nitrospira sp.]
MRKRAGLARALVMEPEIILFDEPTTGLDPLMAKAIHDLIGDAAAVSFHCGDGEARQKSAALPPDYVAMLKNGRIAEMAPSSEFAEGRPMKRFASLFLSGARSRSKGLPAESR